MRESVSDRVQNFLICSENRSLSHGFCGSGQSPSKPPNRATNLADATPRPAAFGGDGALDGGQAPPRRGRRRDRRPAPCRAAAAALAAERLGAEPHQLDRVEAAGQIGGDADDDRRLAVGARDDRDDARADAPLQIVGQ